MPHSYCNLLYHIVFSTKDRRPWMDKPLQERVRDYMGGTIRNMGGILLVGGAVEDHVHLLAKLRGDVAVSKAIGEIKACATGWVHETFPKLSRFQWQVGYGAFTVSASQVKRLERYILNQEVHHRTQTFQEEFIALLKAHGVEYDERYIWR